MMPHIQTYTGVQFDVMDPTPEMINIEDIAHALANIPRFGGHTKEFYSVAQHSVFVADMLHTPEYIKAGLLHDATEAYVLDMMTPIKCRLPDYQAIYDKIERAIMQRFDVRFDYASVKRADVVALATEKRDLMSRGEWWTVGALPMPERIVALPPSIARKEFLNRWAIYG